MGRVATGDAASTQGFENAGSQSQQAARKNRPAKKTLTHEPSESTLSERPTYKSAGESE
jgi:hypothetical protein